MSGKVRYAKVASAFLIGLLAACGASEPMSPSVQPEPSRADDWPSVADDERPGPFLPVALSDPTPPWGKCLLEAPRGALYYFNPTLRIAAYASPGGGYFIERYGTEPLDSEASIRELNARHASQFATQPRWLSIDAISLCTYGPPWPYPPACLGAEAQRRETTLAQVTDRIGELLKDEGNHCIGVLLLAAGWDVPRCAASDPSCQPLPYCDSPSELCADAQPYRPDARRHTVSQLAGLTAGSCQHDGDCVLNDCGNACTSYTNYGLSGTCPFYTDLAPAFCGCVEHECWWFTQ